MVGTVLLKKLVFSVVLEIRQMPTFGFLVAFDVDGLGHMTGSLQEDFSNSCASSAGILPLFRNAGSPSFCRRLYTYLHCTYFLSPLSIIFNASQT